MSGLKLLSRSVSQGGPLPRREAVAGKGEKCQCSALLGGPVLPGLSIDSDKSITRKRRRTNGLRRMGPFLPEVLDCETIIRKFSEAHEAKLTTLEFLGLTSGLLVPFIL